MKITVIDTKTGKARVMERRFAQILSKLGKVRRPEPIRRKPKVEERLERNPRVEEPLERNLKAEEPIERNPKVEERPRKREYKRRDLKAEE